MFFAYILKSRDYDFLYKGHCEDLNERINQHNSGMTKSIKPYLPFELVYKEKFETRDEAIKREKYFKSAAGRRYLKKLLAPYFNG
ncbi:MAG: GIY-YIG nuclease family protein [Bacteroidia bacterium]|nr:GIY-YIG nuclease family protein [Bacteroidia bacterium]